MAENKSTIDDANKQTNQGANDNRIAPMNEELREAATKGGKATPTPVRHAPSQPHDEDDGESSEDKRGRGDQRGKNSDDELNARGGMMGGATKPGAEELKR